MDIQKFIQKKISNFVNKLNKDLNISSILLFGSAQDINLFNKYESDIDLVVISEDFKNKTFIERLELLDDYLALDNYLISALPYTQAEFDNASKFTVLGQAKLTGEVVFSS